MASGILEVKQHQKSVILGPVTQGNITETHEVPTSEIASVMENITFIYTNINEQNKHRVSSG